MSTKETFQSLLDKTFPSDPLKSKYSQDDPFNSPSKKLNSKELQKAAEILKDKWRKP